MINYWNNFNKKLIVNRFEIDLDKFLKGPELVFLTKNFLFSIIFYLLTFSCENFKFITIDR